MGRRNDHTREQLKEMAIAAAEQIIAEEGYMALSTRRVAKQIGYTVGSLYMVFANLDDLVLTVNGRTLESLYQKIVVDLRQISDPSAALHQIAQSYVVFATENMPRWSLIYMHHLGEGSDMSEEYLQKIRQLFGIIGQYTQYLPGLSPDANIEQLSRLLWGSVHGVVALALDRKLSIATDASPPLSESVRVLVSAILNGLTR